jgi:hypothetical protein
MPQQEVFEHSIVHHVLHLLVNHPAHGFRFDSGSGSGDTSDRADHFIAAHDSMNWEHFCCRSLKHVLRELISYAPVVLHPAATIAFATAQ